MCSFEKDLVELIKSVKNGDDDACAELLQAYAPLIGKTVRATVMRLPASSNTDEDELRQEAAIKLYQAAMSYDPESEVSFGLYAKICIRNRMISLLRRYHDNAELFADDLTEEILDGVVASDPSEAVLDSEQEHELDGRIRDILSPLEYDVFNLYIDGEKPTEIAKALGISVKTAENAVYRMRSKIGKLLN